MFDEVIVCHHRLKNAHQITFSEGIESSQQRHRVEERFSPASDRPIRGGVSVAEANYLGGDER